MEVATSGKGEDDLVGNLVDVTDVVLSFKVVTNSEVYESTKPALQQLRGVLPAVNLALSLRTAGSVGLKEASNMQEKLASFEMDAGWAMAVAIEKGTDAESLNNEAQRIAESLADAVQERFLGTKTN
jgi:hypothetical protein